MYWIWWACASVTASPPHGERNSCPGPSLWLCPVYILLVLAGRCPSSCAAKPRYHEHQFWKPLQQRRTSPGTLSWRPNRRHLGGPIPYLVGLFLPHSFFSTHWAMISCGDTGFYPPEKVYLAHRMLLQPIICRSSIVIARGVTGLAIWQAHSKWYIQMG